MLLSLACLAGFSLLVLPSQREQVRGAVAAQAVRFPEVAQAMTAAAAVLGLPSPPVAATPTLTAFVVQPLATGGSVPATPARATSIPPTRTPFLVQPTAVNGNLADPATATVAAALTMASGIQLTAEPTPTALPVTGIAGESDALPLVIAALALIAIVFLARRLRSAGGKPSDPA